MIPDDKGRYHPARPLPPAALAEIEDTIDAFRQEQDDAQEEVLRYLIVATDHHERYMHCLGSRRSVRSQRQSTAVSPAKRDATRGYRREAETPYRNAVGSRCRGSTRAAAYYRYAVVTGAATAAQACAQGARVVCYGKEGAYAGRTQRQQRR